MQNAKHLLSHLIIIKGVIIKIHFTDKETKNERDQQISQ